MSQELLFDWFLRTAAGFSPDQAHEVQAEIDRVYQERLAKSSPKVLGDRDSGCLAASER
jgi:hypothetical protein